MFFFAISEKPLMKRRWSLAKPRYVRLVSVRKSSVIPTSILLGPGLSLGLISHLCPGFHGRNHKFYDSSKKNPKRSFALYDFPLLLRFSHLPEGVLNYTNSAKIEKNGDHDHSLQFTFFCSLLVCLASQTALPNLTNSAKTVKNRNLNYFSHLTICRYFIVFLSDLPDGASEFNKFCENGEKSLSKRLVVLYDFSLLLCFVLLREGASEFN